MKMFFVLINLIIIGFIGGCTHSGNTAQSVQLAGRPVFSAKPGTSTDVTAACAGRTSDATTIQRAINSSAAGSLIVIRGPVCLLNRGIQFLGDRTYTGYSSVGTVLKQDGAMSYVLGSRAYAANTAFTGDPATIRDLTVECSGSGNTNGIVVLGWQTDVESVDVNNCGGSGIVDTNMTANGHAIGNTSVNSRFDNNFISDSKAYGFEVRDSGSAVTDGFLENNLIANSGRDAIHLEDSAGWDVSGNHLYSDSQNGIYASRLFGTTISNNYIEDFGSAQKRGTWYAIVATVQGGDGSTVFNNKIFNDRGEGRVARYIYLCVTATNYGTGFLSVTGNVIVGDRAGDVGVALSGGTHKLVVASAGNEIADVGIAHRNASSVAETAGT